MTARAVHRDGAGGAFPARLLAGALLGLAVVLYLCEFGLNLHVSTGIPYWDDWGYFFGEAQGVQQPLTLHSLLAKDSDHVAPLFKLLTHALWRVIGVDFVGFRLLGWIVYGAMLALYAALLLRVCVRSAAEAVPVAAAGLLLVSTANAEYFYYQAMGLAQPFIFLCLFGFLYAMAARRWWLAGLLLLGYGGTGVFGSSYLLGSAGAALLGALAAGRLTPRALLADPRVRVAVLGGVALTLLMFALTFIGSYANHTEQALVWPWEKDFWFFVLGAFAAAAGVPADAPTDVVAPYARLAVGAALFLAFAVPALLLPLLRRGDDDDDDGDEDGDGGAAPAFVLSALLAGSILLTLATAVGRSHLCGDGGVVIMGCGASPRYAFPVVLALPALMAAWMRLLPAPALRLAAGAALAVAILGLHLLGLHPLDPHSPDRRLEPSLARWDFSRLNQVAAARDHAAATCLAVWLQDGDEDRPLYCPTVSPRNIAPYLAVARRMDAAFARPLMEGTAGERATRELRRRVMAATLEGATLRTEPPLTPDAARLTGWADSVMFLKYGTPVITGWAADLGRREPAALVAAVAGGRVVGIALPGRLRPDVAAALGAPGFAAAGFAVPVPAGRFEGTAVRVFALSADGAVTELQPPGGVTVPATAPGGG